ncbi:hypothetical protein [Acidovorax sp. A1169]|uniref:hypothetical protein n=1 Tax=Acidovorax sp. A1169 TaxID=3059524 RepID=UPI002737D774|nr:hypothetical protein [Acidovorax sp. A1169]MDP4076272.1 hypothetical protein [Acidovorax sp. A1169]
MAEHTLAIDDPTGRLPEDVRQRALASADAVLAHYGVTVEECAAVGTRPFKPVAPGGVHNFFADVGKAATTWLEACAVVQDLCGPDLRLIILDKQAPLPH